MLSNLFYLSVLIDKSAAFNLFQKQEIFKKAKNDRSLVLKLIRIFEDELVNRQKIQEDYDEKVEKIEEHLIDELLEEWKKQELEKVKNFKNNLRKTELSEKENLDIDNLLNNL